MKQKSIEELMRALAYTRPIETPSLVRGLSSSETERLSEQYRTAFHQWERDVRAVARAAHNTNPSFKFGLFYRGVGLEDKI